MFSLMWGKIIFKSTTQQRPTGTIKKEMSNMAVKTGYEFNGEVVTNLQELSQIIGVPQVKRKDVEEGGKFADQVNIVDLDDEEATEQVEQQEQASEEPKSTEANEEVEETKEEASEDEAWEDGYPQDKKEEEVQEEASAEDILEVLGEIESLDEFKEFFKDLDTETAEICVNALDLEIKPTDNPNIYRMRLSMALQRHLFPEHFKPKKSEKKTKYGDYSTEELQAMAKKNKVEFEANPHEGINRMRLIMALKKSGHLTAQ
jgi:HJR/Mrr/RecB family endonuclease